MFGTDCRLPFYDNKNSYQEDCRVGHALFSSRVFLTIFFKKLHKLVNARIVVHEKRGI